MAFRARLSVCKSRRVSLNLHKHFNIETISDHGGITDYSTASTPTAAYVIGGGRTAGVIAEFKNYAWRQLGSMLRGRYQHGSILLDDEFMVIGGHGR